MTRRLMWIGLAVSLALNFLFVGGAFHARATAERLTQRPEMRTQHFTEQLELRPQQRQAYQAFRTRARERVAGVRAELGPTFQEMRDQLGADAPDPERLAAGLLHMADTRHAFERDMAGLTGEFLRTLDPDQMRHFLNFARRKSWQSTLGLVPSRRARPGNGRRQRTEP